MPFTISNLAANVLKKMRNFCLSATGRRKERGKGRERKENDESEKRKEEPAKQATRASPDRSDWPRQLILTIPASARSEV